MLVHQIVNSYQHACTYILYEEDSEYVWLVDCAEQNMFAAINPDGTLMTVRNR